MTNRFNIRVYGLLINEQNQILIADERLPARRAGTNGYTFTKFPGGGLEWGEGTIDCLKREFQEETELHIEVGTLFYCTDFFQKSAFIETDQLISIYYFVTAEKYKELKTCDVPFQDDTVKETFRWVDLKALTSEIMTFPIDKLVVEKLKNHFNF